MPTYNVKTFCIGDLILTEIFIGNQNANIHQFNR